MLIYQRKGGTGYGRHLLSGLLLLAVLLTVYFGFFSGHSHKTSISPDVFPVYWDAERLAGELLVSSDGHTLSGPVTRTTEHAHSGNHACLTGKSDKIVYGMTYLLRGVRPGQVYKASVWRKKGHYDVKSYLVVEGAKESGLYLSTSEVSRKDAGGWNQLELLFVVPKAYPGDQLKIYVFTDGQAEVYWDDLKIDKLEPGEKVAGFSLPRIDLEVKDQAYRRLQAKRKKAMAAGILKTEADSWVKGMLRDSTGSMPVRLRLKGDWLDHLTSDKWSFRVKVKDPHAWNRMKEFSFHNPRARYYTHEWLLHRFWEREEVLTTRYDFVQLYLNGKHLGIYAFEEHFDKQLLEYRSRREGPILKFSEDALWEARIRQKQSGALDDQNLPAVAEMVNAEVSVFKEKRTTRDEQLWRSFQIASELLEAYQLQQRPAGELFELDKMARYYAVADVMGAHHALIWHNQRFYFNPVLSLLEPIGFDGYSNLPRSEALLLGKEMIENGRREDIGAMKKLFENEGFIHLYMYYLNKYANEDYLSRFLDETSLGLKARIDLLKSEFPEVRFSRERILKRASGIRAKLLPYNQYSVKAAWKERVEGPSVLLISSIHELPLQVVGLGAGPEVPTERFEQPIALAPFYLGQPKTYREVKADRNYRYVFYQPFGIDTLFSCAISRLPVQEGERPVEQFYPDGQLNCPIPFVLAGETLYIKKGSYTLSEPIRIPAGLKVMIEAGTEVNMTQGAGFLSYSPVYLNGTPETAVVFRSEDRSGGGFTVLKAASESLLSYCIFEGLGSLERNGLSLTGALTFYESDLKIDHCLIRNNQCEDALNTIRSRIDIEALSIRDAPFDGFDADFCSGRITNSSVFRSGNDGFDFSGSNIELYLCNFEQCGDKGISVGEESRVVMDRIRIREASIGLVSKDLSYVKALFVELQNCNQGFAAYQKKPEFGYSSLVVEDYRAEEVRILHSVGRRCTLELKNNVIIGE